MCQGLWGLAVTSTEKIMNWKKFFIAFIAAFVFLFVFGFVWYGHLMHGIHNEVPVLWRPEADFGNYFPWLIFGHIVMAFFLTLLCAKFVPGGGAGACAGLGILVLLKDIYVQTSTLWRSQREMMSLFHWIIIGQALVVFAFVSMRAVSPAAA